MTTTITATMLVVDAPDQAVLPLPHSLERVGGKVVHRGGPGIMAAFTSVAAAVGAAVELQRVARQRGGVADRPRVGVATGEADVDGGEYFGRPVIEATRLADRAQSGQILVTELVRLIDGGRGGIRFEPAGEVVLAGLEHPLVAAEVVWDETAGDAGRLTVPLPMPLAFESAVPFVDRPAEWERLELAWLAAREGRRQVVLVGGEPGAGKTRIVTELARAAHRRAGIVLYGACTEEIEMPYQPFAEALDHAVASLPATQVAALAADGAEELTRILPHLPDPAGTHGSDRNVDPDAQRYRLHESVTGMLTVLSAHAPVLVVLDDLHWAGRPAVQLLEHLVRSPRLTRVAIVATFRNAPADVRAPLRESLPELRRRPGVDRITLTGFDRDGVRAFVAALAGHEVDDPLEPVVDHLEQATDGNAFLLTELWQQLVSNDLVGRVEGRWRPTGPLAAIDSPESVREVVAARVALLPESTRTILELAAVTGPTFALDVVAAAAGLDAGAAFDALEPAIAARLLDDAGGHRFRFAHALVRQSIEDALGPGVRRRHHLAIAHALTDAASGDSADLAHHFIEAVPLAPVATAVAHARRAADDAMRFAAYENASDILGRVLPLVTDRAERADLLISEANAALRAGGTTEAIRLCGRAAGVAREIGDHDLLVRAALRVVDATWRGAAFGGPAAALVSQALEGPNDDATHARLLAGLSTALAFSGRDDEAIVQSAEAIAAARAVGDRGLLLDTLLCPTFVAWRPQTIDQQMRAAEEGVALAEELGDEEALVGRLDKLLAGLMLVGDVDRHARALERHGALARSLRQPLFQLIDLQVNSTLALNRGHFAEAEALAAEANRWSDELPHASGGYGVQMFAIRREQGRLDEIRPVVEAVARLGREGSTWRPGLAALYAELDMLEECRTLVSELVEDDLAAVPRDSLWLGALTFLADACHALDDAEAARVVHAHLRPYGGLTANVPALACFGAVDRYLGRLTEVLGRPTEAIVHYEAAVDQDERTRWPVWMAHSQLALGRLLARGSQTSRARARPLLIAALATAGELGMRAVAAACERTLSTLAAGSAPVAALTPRELSVLRCVADGRTNRQIGDTLHLSQHTVANHMRAILLKTGTASRAEAAVYAERRGLLDGG